MGVFIVEGCRLRAAGTAVSSGEDLAVEALMTTTSRPARPSPGTTLSHFRIVAELGVGGMGEVYPAEDERLGREVEALLEESAPEPD